MNVLKFVPRNKPRSGLSQADVLARIDEDLSDVRIGRNRIIGEPLEFGPNMVHAVWGHGPSGETGRPGTYTDLGWARNLKTTTGMTWLRGLMGGVLPTGTMAVSNACTATTYGVATTPWTAHQLQGMRIVVPITNITTQPVFGNIGENTNALITVDQWYTQTLTTGTTPAVGNFGLIVPGQTNISFIGLSDTGCTPAIGNTTIASSGGTEYITVGLNRAICTYADASSTTFTQYHLWTASGAGGNVKTAAAFTSNGPPASCPGIMVAITDLNAQANLAATDTLAVTWTWTIPSAG